MGEAYGHGAAEFDSWGAMECESSSSVPDRRCVPPQILPHPLTVFFLGCFSRVSTPLFKPPALVFFGFPTAGLGAFPPPVFFWALPPPPGPRPHGTKP